MKRRAVSIITAAVMIMILFAACGKKTATSFTEKTNTETSVDDKSKNTKAELLEDPVNIEIISKGFQHSYWQSVLKGAESKAEELGVMVNFKGPGTESDVAAQVQMLNDAIRKKPKAIALAAIDAQACMESIKKAQAAGIPVISFDSRIPNVSNTAVLATASTDNYNAGAIAADEIFIYIKDRIANAKGRVRIGIIAQDDVGESVVNRGLGFIDRMGELIADMGKSVNIEGNDRYAQECRITRTDDADVILEVAVPAEVTEELSTKDCLALMKKPDTICLYGSNQHSGEAMLRANEESERKLGTGDDQIIGLAFDSGKMIKEAVSNGTLAGAVTQAPFNIGAVAVELCVKAAQGEEVSDVDTGCSWYTADNIKNPEIAVNLYD